MTMEPPWCDATSVIVPCSGLPRARRSAGSSMPWSQELRTRWVSGSVIFSTRRLVQFGRFALRHQLDLLVELGGQVAQHAREAVEHHRHRNHPDRHDRFLQVAGVAFEVGQAGQQLLVQLAFAAVLGQHGLRDHEFADEVDQLVDLLDRDAQRGLVGRRHGLLDGLGGGLGRGGDGRRRGDGLGFGGGRSRRGFDRRGVGQRLEEAVARIDRVFFGRGAGVLREEAEAGVGRAHLDQFARHMEREQVQQVGVGRGRHDAEAAHAVRGAAAVQGFDRAEVLDLLEQLAQGVGGLGLVQRADDQLDGARLRLGHGHRLQRRARRPRSARGAALAFTGAGAWPSAIARMRPSSSLVSGALLAEPWCTASCAFSASPAASSTSTIADVGVSSWRRSLSSSVSIWCVSAATSEKAERGGAALDRMRATEDGVHLLVVGRVDVELQQLLLHQLQVLAGFFEEDLVELAQVDAGRAAVVTDLTHSSFS